jgi:hypothetical protein
MCRMSRNPGALTSRTAQGHVGLFRGYFTFYLYNLDNSASEQYSETLSGYVSLVSSSFRSHFLSTWNHTQHLPSAFALVVWRFMNFFFKSFFGDAVSITDVVFINSSPWRIIQEGIKSLDYGNWNNFANIVSFCAEILSKPSPETSGCLCPETGYCYMYSVIILGTSR